MKPGTPGFVGARLREAREARTLTIVTLAELVGVSRQIVSAYEHGDATPQPDTLYRIANVLDMPVPFFSLPSRHGDDSPTFYRSLAGASKTSRLAAERRLDWVGDIAEYLADFVRFPDVRVPQLIQRSKAPLDHAVIERAATDLRRQWGFGDEPIHSMVGLVEATGGFVTRGEAASEAIDAFSKWMPVVDRPFLFLGSEKGSRARTRFDAAHELGHMVIHRGVSRSQVAVPAELSALESEANMFASAFLLPAQSFAEDLFIPTLDGMRTLKPKWKVSIAAMLHRATDLRIVDENHARRMWISSARRGWRRGEPDDDVIPPENPSALRRAVELVVEARLQTPAQLLERIVLGPNDFQRFASLPDGYFQDQAPVRLLDRSARRPTDEGPAAEAPVLAQIVPFPRSG